jgi:hypothetical protein
MSLVTFDQVRNDPKVRALVEGANTVMVAMGYTEHGHRHVGIVAGITRYILETMGQPEREIQLGQIAAYLHDIGIVVRREGHPLTGGCIAFQLLDQMGMAIDEIVRVVGAIGNHEETGGTPVSILSAAVIIADKSDVHRSRVQSPIEDFDIHDRVNYAVQQSRVEMDAVTKRITLTLDIDAEFASVMQYFEIFLNRMVMCRRAANLLGYRFCLRANGTHLE